jgi:hypothetical protein
MRTANVSELSMQAASAALSDWGMYTLPPCRLSDPKVAAFLAEKAAHVDYSNIVELSPAAAECFVKMLNGDEDAGNEPAVEDETPWALNGLRAVSPELASVLGSYCQGPLHLDGLTSLSRESAQHLSHLPYGALSLDGLTDVSADVLSHLLRTSRGVCLNAVEMLGPEHAEVLSAGPTGWQTCPPPQWQLQLNSLRFVPDVTAEAIVRCAKGMRRVVHEDKWSPLVTLDGLVVLDSPALARAIDRGDRPVIQASLTTIQWISARAAAELGQRIWVELPRLRHLTRAVARGFADGGARISLGAVSAITPEIASEFGKKSAGELVLDGLVDLSAEIAEELARAAVSRLSLNGLKSLDTAVANKLAFSRADRIELRGLDAVDDSVAAELSRFQGKLAIDRLTSGGGLPKVLHSPLASVLRKHPGALDLGGVEELTDAAAEDLSLHGGPHILLDDVQVVPAHVAEKLAKYRGKLSLCGVKRLTDEAAAKISEYEGWALILRGLESPSRAQVTTLSRNPRIKLPTQ